MNHTVVMEFDSKLTTTIDALRGLESRAEIIRRAITLYKTCVDAEEGSKLFLISALGERTEITGLKFNG